MSIRTRAIAAVAAVFLAIPAGVALASTAGAAGCSASLGGSCGGYSSTQTWPGSNGFNTYVSNQNVGANSGTTESLSAPDESGSAVTPVTIVPHAVPLGYTGVQTFPDVQQLTNNWDGTNNWNGQDVDTPVDGLSSLVVNYSETSPGGPNNIFEFAPDIWTNYAGQDGPGSGDIMFWADTSPIRCNDNGLDNTNIVGHVTLQGQNWTAYRYGGVGDEIVLILNTTSPDPVDTDTCAQQTSGSIDIKGGLDWLSSQGLLPHGSGPLTMGQLNTGWEITSGDGSAFTLNSYSVTTAIGGQPSPSPSPTPTPTQTSPSPSPTPTPTLPANSVLLDAQGSGSKTGTTPLTWTQNVGTSANRVLLAESTVGTRGDIGCTQTLTDNGHAMTKLGVFHTNGQHDGFMDVWVLNNPPSGRNTLKMTVSHCRNPALTGTSESFSGVSQVSAVTSALGYSTSAHAQLTAIPGDVVAGFVAAGNSIGAPAAPVQNSLIRNVNSLTGAGNSGEATAAGTGSSVSFTWPVPGNDWWAVGLVDLQPAN
jgi:hypothetical protein